MNNLQPKQNVLQQNMAGSSDLRTPKFNGSNYDFWLVKMETILIAYDLWDVIEFGTLPQSNPEEESKEGTETGSSKVATTVVFDVTKEMEIKNAKTLSSFKEQYLMSCFQE